MKTIVTISHTDYTTSLGGIEKVILEQSALFQEEGYNVLHICPVSKSVIFKNRTIYSKRRGYKILFNDSIINPCADFKAVLSEIEKVEVYRIIIHSIIGLEYGNIIKLLRLHDNIESYFVIHDYKSICEGHNLLKNKTNYCGDDGRSLLKCCACRFFWTGFTNSNQYRSLIGQFPKMHYVFPSKVACNIWSKSYPTIEEDHKLVIPHQVLLGDMIEPSRKNDKIRIAYIGYKSFNKGWSAFRDLCKNDKTNRHEYYVLGKTNEIPTDVKVVPVSFIEEGEDAMVKAIRRNKIDVAILWSPWPETYSFTLFESYVGGAYIITNIDSGNIQRQVQDLNCGRVFDNINEMKDFVYSDTFEEIINKEKNIRPSSLAINKEGIKKMI